MRVKPTLCCLFKEQPIKFKTFTIKGLEKLSFKEKKEKVISIYNYNIESLQSALNKCNELGIESYRISSNLLPKFDFVQKENIIDTKIIEIIEFKLKEIKTYDILLSMHPDQFCIMNSPNEEVVKNSVEILKYHFWLARNLSIDSINIHVGGVYGDKKSAIDRFKDNCNKYLTRNELDLLTIENDEKSFSIEDILDICSLLSIRPTFDIHHDKCYSIKNYDYYGKIHSFRNKLNLCKIYWKLKGFSYVQVHLSSPRDDRYETLKGSQPHANYILEEDYIDFSFLDFDVVVDIEAKSKELAVLEYNKSLNII